VWVALKTKPKTAGWASGWFGATPSPFEATLRFAPQDEGYWVIPDPHLTSPWQGEGSIVGVGSLWVTNTPPPLGEVGWGVKAPNA
jgi:hypothetical protein